MATPFKSARSRDDIASFLKQEIDLGLTAREGQQIWWDQVEITHRNERQTSSTDESGQIDIWMPLYQPRADKLAGILCQVVGGQKPFFLCDDMPLPTSVSGSNVEMAMHHTLRSAGWESTLRAVAETAIDTNCAIAKISFDFHHEDMLAGTDEDEQVPMSIEGPVTYAGIKYEMVHPRHFVVRPASLGGITSSYLYGNRFYTTAKHIEMMQQQQIYLGDDGDIVSGADPFEHDEAYRQRARISPDSSGEQSLGEVELWDVYFRHNEDRKPEKWYRATLAYQNGFILDVEEYPYKQPCCYPIGALKNSRGFWPVRSLGRNAYEPQSAYNNLWSAFYNAAMRMGQLNIIGPPLRGEKTTYVGNIRYIETFSGGQGVFSPPLQYNLGPIVNAIKEVEQSCDQIMGVSANSIGSTFQGNTSATEVATVKQDTDNTIEEIVSQFSASFGPQASFIAELLSVHYDMWAAVNPQFPDVTAAVFAQSVGKWECAGSHIQATPNALLGQSGQLMQITLQAGSQLGWSAREAGKLYLKNASKIYPGAEQILIPDAQWQQMQMQQQMMQNQANGQNSGPQPGGQSGGNQPPGLPSPPGASGMGGQQTALSDQGIVGPEAGRMSAVDAGVGG